MSRLIYLNWAGDLAPDPPNPRLEEEIRRYAEMQGRWAGNADAAWNEFWSGMKRARASLAPFFGVSPDAHQFLFTTGTLHGLQILTSSYSARPGDFHLVRPGMKVLTTDIEYGDIYRELDGRFDISVVRILDAEGEDDLVDRVVNAAERVRPDILLLSHVSLLDGLVLPVAKMARALRARFGKDLFIVVDGAQSAGNIQVNLDELDVDLYIGCFHKWLQGPNLTGFAYWRNADHVVGLAHHAIHVLSFDESILRKANVSPATGCSKIGLHAPQSAALADHLEFLFREGLAAWDGEYEHERAEQLRRRLEDGGLGGLLLGPHLASDRSGIVSLRLAAADELGDYERARMFGVDVLHRIHRGDPRTDAPIAATTYYPRVPDNLSTIVRQPAILRFSCFDKWNSKEEIDIAADRIIRVVNERMKA